MGRGVAEGKDSEALGRILLPLGWAVLFWLIKV